jgi:uncharacterized protein (DUF433 family)
MVITTGSVIHSDPDILGGIPVFMGTRVPLQNLIDYLSAGDTLDDFLRSFPTVSREQATAALARPPTLWSSLRALLDEQVPVELATLIRQAHWSHDIRTVADMDWG